MQPIYPVSHLLGEAVLAEVRLGDRMLDMGTGCGVNGILAARAGAEVLALESTPRLYRRPRTTPVLTESPTGSRSGSAMSSARLSRL